MSWFKENKFLGGLIAITALLAALIIFLGVRAGGALEEVQEKIAAKEQSLKGMKGLDPYPTNESVKAKKASLEALVAKANQMQAKVLTFRPASLANIPVDEFAAKLQKTEAEVRALFPEAVIPEKAYLGFERYASSLPKGDATGVLNYQLDAHKYLFEQLAEAKIKEVTNLLRAELPPERGEEWNAKPQRSGNRSRNSSNRGNSRNARNKSKGAALPEVAHRLPIELTFRARESAVRQLFTALADSDQYFFDVRLVRIKNESGIPSAPKVKSVDAPESGGDDDGFGGLENEPEAGDAPASSGSNLLKIAGSEDLAVYFRADLLLFKDGQKFPEIK